MRTSDCLLSSMKFELGLGVESISLTMGAIIMYPASPFPKMMVHYSMNLSGIFDHVLYPILLIPLSHMRFTGPNELGQINLEAQRVGACNHQLRHTRHPRSHTGHTDKTNQWLTCDPFPICHILENRTSCFCHRPQR